MELCGQAAALVQIGASQNAVVNIDVPALAQQANKGTVHRAAVGGADMTVKVFLYAGPDLFRFRQHIRKCHLFRFIKAVIGNAGHMKVRFQQGNHLAGIGLPLAEIGAFSYPPFKDSSENIFTLLDG